MAEIDAHTRPSETLPSSQPPKVRATNVSEQFERSLLARQIAMVCRNSDAAVVTGLLAALCVCWIFWPDYSFARIGGWYATLAAVSIIRVVLQRRVRAVVDTFALPRLRRTQYAMMFGLIVFGLVWSAPTLWTLSDPNRMIAFGACVFGIAAASMFSLSPLRHAYASFVLPFMLPFAVRYLHFDDPIMYGVGALLYLAAMFGLSRRQYSGIRGALLTQLENETLLARIQEENAIIERANRRLQNEIEQRESTEADLRLAKDAAEAANRAKDQFLANMSHELRTPLNGMLGMSELLQRTRLEPKQQKYVQTMQQSGQRLLHIVNDILDVARAQAGRLKFESVEFSPRALLADLLEEHRGAANAKRIALQTEVDTAVPPRLRGDPNRLRQILGNLLGNAIKFTAEGGVIVKLSPSSPQIVHDAGEAIRLRWSVTDTGPGIAPDDRARLFKPFSQLDESSTRKFGGAGLGLAICQQLVQAQGGHIHVESEPGKGSTFWFELPLGRADYFGTNVFPAMNLSALKQLNARVLVAEDNAANRLLTQEMLELMGCSTLLAQNGAQALDLLQSEQVDVVLMDWHMPGMDGLTTTRAIREREEQNASHRIPIIAVTASVLPGDRETCLAAGMDDFLAKPLTIDQLFNALQRWLPARAA